MTLKVEQYTCDGECMLYSEHKHYVAWEVEAEEAAKTERAAKLKAEREWWTNHTCDSECELEHLLRRNLDAHMPQLVERMFDAKPLLWSLRPRN